MKHYSFNVFGGENFLGNQAGVVELDSPITDQSMQKIANEINLPATSFIYKEKNDWKIFWFSVKSEIQLCGHGTLAAAAHVFNKYKPSDNEVFFTSTSNNIFCRMKNDNFYEMDIPANHPHPLIKEIQKENLGLNIKFVSMQQTTNEVTLAELENEMQVKSFVPNFDYLLKNKTSLLLTAPGETSDFVYRYFAPSYGELEDAATGSAQAILAPFWSQRLKKNKFVSNQISKNGGLFYTSINGYTVTIGGNCVSFES